MSRRTHLVIYFIGIFLIGLIFTWIRMPMLTIENSVKGWNSDYAIFVMIGEDILSGKDFSFFYWGGNYLGPLNGFFMGLTQKIMELFGYQQTVHTLPEIPFVIGPLAASINCLWMMFAGTFFYGLAFLRLYSVWETLLACLLLSIGGESFIRFSLRPLGPEVSYFLGGLLCWRGLALIQNPSRLNQIIFGFLFGFSWWMNQIVVFVLVPIFYFLVSNTEEYKNLRSHLRLNDRFLLRTEKLGLGSLNKFLKYFLHFLYGLLAINFLMGSVISLIGGVNERFLGVKLKIHNGFSPMKTSLLIFIATQFMIWLFKDPKSKKTLKEIFIRIRFFLFGLVIGYGPVIVGRILKLYEKGYKPNFKFVALKHIPIFWYNIITDFFPRLLVPKEWYFLAPLLFILIFTSLKTAYNNRKSVSNYLKAMPVSPPIESIFWGVFLFNFLYVFLCERVHENYVYRTAFRYALLTLPIFSLFFVTLWRRYQKRVVGITLSLITILTFGSGQYLQGQKFLKVMQSQSNNREKIELILNSDCELFQNDYWDTYLYEYLTQRQKKFVVKDDQRGLDRTRKRTDHYKSLDFKKCQDFIPLN